MYVLFTDFGLTGPYTGQMKAVLLTRTPRVPIIDLIADAPSHNPFSSAYLLAAYYKAMPEGAIFLTVVDPGVGGSRRPIVAEIDNRFFVGPDNGLLELVARRTANKPDSKIRCWEIVWRPSQLSASFHGRDLFAPVASFLCSDPKSLDDRSQFAPLEPHDIRYPDWPDDLHEVIYSDTYGNLITGIRSSQMSQTCQIKWKNTAIYRASTFSDVKTGETFWYENSNGLVELATNQGNAAQTLGAKRGDKLEIVEL